VPKVHRHPPRVSRLRREEVPCPFAEDDTPAAGGTPFEGVWRLADMPEWLHAIARPEYLKTAIERSVPEFSSGAMVLQDARPRSSRLRDGLFAGLFDLTVEGPGGARGVVCLRECGTEAAGRGWPEAVVAKTYWRDKGRVAYEGMRALWESELRRSSAVIIAEPLAFIPELRVLIQAAVPHESTLQDLLRSVL